MPPGPTTERDSATICDGKSGSDGLGYWRIRGDGMSERTQLHVGKTNYTVPKITKRLIEIVMGTVLTAIVILAVLTLDNVLTGKSGWYGGYAQWLKFMQQSDILGTMLLTAGVTVAFVYWYRGTSKR
jgi:hypothetical protein